MEEEDVYCAQFVNLKIFSFVQVEKKLPIYFPSFQSSLRRVVSEKRMEFGL